MKDKILFVMAFMCVMVLASCGGDNGGSSSSSGGYSYPTTIYDVLDINGAKYACYGYRSPVTFESAWNLTTHSGKLRLPCGTLAKAESGTHDYDYMFYIHLKGNKDLGKGSKLEDFSPKFEPVGEGEINYVSGFATVTDKKNNDYITIKFESFKFGSGSKTYVLNGTVQLMIEESGDNSGGNGGGTSSTNSITLIKSNGEKYVSIAQFPFTQQNGTTKNGYLTTNGEIWCMMSKESAFNPTYLHIKLLKGEKAISDFPQGYDLGNVNVTFGQIKYTYQSGSVKVNSNGGNSFMLEFKDYIGKNSMYSTDVTINGTLLCEKEVLL